MSEEIFKGSGNKHSACCCCHDCCFLTLSFKCVNVSSITNTLFQLYHFSLVFNRDRDSQIQRKEREEKEEEREKREGKGREG